MLIQIIFIFNVIIIFYVKKMYSS